VVKLQTVITFDREIRWRRVNNESCSKRGNKSSCHWPHKKSKNPSFTIILFLFFSIIWVFFRYFEVLVLILTLIRKF